MCYPLEGVSNAGLSHIFIFGKLHFEQKMSIVFNRNRCLAHVINLATQALISGYSKTKYFDPAHPEAHEPESLEHFERDVVGLIRAITVKVLYSCLIVFISNWLTS
jgi:hypothetical protein